LDFSNEEDRIAACKWYADLLEERFRSSGFRHLELAGFYWLPEILRQSREVTRALGDYVRSKGLRFYWIPYYTAQGYSEWRDLGFDGRLPAADLLLEPQDRRRTGRSGL